MAMDLLRVWRSLPYDGQGLSAPADASLAALRRRAASARWLRAPWWSRPLLIPMGRLAGYVALMTRALGFASHQGLPRPLARRLLLDCLQSGARPNEALVWRQFFRPAGPHPLPGRAAGALLSQLGSPAQHRLLADKQATAETMALAGLPVTPLRGLLAPGQGPDLASTLWTESGQLFIKPRHGSAGRGALAVEVIAAGAYRINGGPVVGAASINARLQGGTDEVLVQARLFAVAELADLATAGVAPVLRLTSARRPGGRPFLHSALLSIDVPGENSRHFIRGQVRAPIDAATGAMAAGICFRHPDQRHAFLPWNRAALAGRTLPGFEQAAEMALQAMSLFPDLPVVNWDLIVTASGPVFLEGNTCGDWILTNLSSLAGLETEPLVPLLQLWADGRDAGAPGAALRRPNGIG